MADPVAPAAPAPQSAQPAAPPRKAVAIRVQKTPPGSQPLTAADRLKEYLKDVPALHGRLTKAVNEQEANVVVAKKTLVEFETTVTSIKALVAKWEQEEQTHVHAGERPAVESRITDHAPAAPVVGPPAPVEEGSPAAPAGGPPPKNAC